MGAGDGMGFDGVKKLDQCSNRHFNAGCSFRGIEQILTYAQRKYEQDKYVRENLLLL